MKQLGTALLLMGAFLAAAAPSAGAQGMPPMDMSWGMRSQMQLQAYGDATAAQAGRNYMLWAKQYRAQTGYMGPLPSPVSQEQLQSSINGANQAGQNYNRAQYYNSQRRDFAVRDYGMRATRGCSYGYNSYGQYVYLCP